MTIATAIGALQFREVTEESIFGGDTLCLLRLLLLLSHWGGLPLHLTYRVLHVSTAMADI